MVNKTSKLLIISVGLFTLCACNPPIREENFEYEDLTSEEKNTEKPYIFDEEKYKFKEDAKKFIEELPVGNIPMDKIDRSFATEIKDDSKFLLELVTKNDFYPNHKTYRHTKYDLFDYGLNDVDFESMNNLDVGNYYYIDEENIKRNTNSNDFLIGDCNKVRVDVSETPIPGTEEVDTVTTEIAASGTYKMVYTPSTCEAYEEYNFPTHEEFNKKNSTLFTEEYENKHLKFIDTMHFYKLLKDLSTYEWDETNLGELPEITAKKDEAGKVTINFWGSKNIRYKDESGMCNSISEGGAVLVISPLGYTETFVYQPTTERFYVDGASEEEQDRVYKLDNAIYRFNVEE